MRLSMFVSFNSLKLLSVVPTRFAYHSLKVWKKDSKRLSLVMNGCLRIVYNLRKKLC